MYSKFNIKQNKQDRDIKEDIEEKLEEYLKYRKQECKLSNGYNPEVINSPI